MKFFAELDKDKKVLRVIVAESAEWCKRYLGGEWVETFRNTDKNFASISAEYNAEKKNFIPIKQYDSWILNEKTCKWEPPIVKPTCEISETKEEYANWNEKEQKWDMVDIKSVTKDG